MKRNAPSLVLKSLSREFASLRQRNLEQDRHFWSQRYQANLDAQRKMQEARFEEDTVPAWLV